ncbi:unnamed protein product [Owenia fusiformis]|uniref:Uncharacterized protein n=1 Tax=Owenia fusiformis TaxID=6347 RepID=A0A8J1TY23_OWEFU|nr:unnamed protein product [Owenia fusiformis]
MMYILLNLAVSMMMFSYINAQCYEDECIGELLVSGPKYRVPDSAFNASSVWDDLYLPFRARLGTKDDSPYGQGGSWVANSEQENTEQWIQVDLGTVKRVSGVITQGRHVLHSNDEQWVMTEYRILYKRKRQETFRTVRKNRSEKFQGNYDAVTPVLNMFKSVRARFIRINPTAWKGHISLRFDVIGCKYYRPQP